MQTRDITGVVPSGNSRGNSAAQQCTMLKDKPRLMISGEVK
jgi:hypothetical protein